MVVYKPKSSTTALFVMLIRENVVMECEDNIENPATQAQMVEYDTLQKIVDQLKSAKYENEAGYLVSNVAFMKLEQMAAEESAGKYKQ